MLDDFATIQKLTFADARARLQVWGKGKKCQMKFITRGAKMYIRRGDMA